MPKRPGHNSRSFSFPFFFLIVLHYLLAMSHWTFVHSDLACDIIVVRLIYQPSIRDTPGFYTWVAALLDL